MKIAIAIALCAACSRRAPIASCADDLRGVYVVDDRRWNVIDGADGYEIYPLFDDIPGERGGLEIAPRVIDIGDRDELSGVVRRRYMRGTARCDAKVPIKITRCADDTLELVLADPVPPLAFAPCAWPHPAPAHVERWRRE